MTHLARGLYISSQKKRLPDNYLTMCFLLKFDSYGRHVTAVHALSGTTNKEEVILRGLRKLLWSPIWSSKDCKFFRFLSYHLTSLLKEDNNHSSVSIKSLIWDI